jgi:hypothetical protein
VKTLGGRRLLLDYAFMAYLVKVKDQILLATLYILDIKDFDLILRMDCLAKYYAMINYRKRDVTFQILRQDIFFLKEMTLV